MMAHMRVPERPIPHTINGLILLIVLGDPVAAIYHGTTGAPAKSRLFRHFATSRPHPLAVRHMGVRRAAASAEWVDRRGAALHLGAPKDRPRW